MIVDIIINAVICLFGVYLIAISMKMKKEQKLNPVVIAKEDISKCKNVAGYIDFVVPKMIIFGAMIIIVGLVGILEEFYEIFYRYRFITLVIFLIAFALYINEMRKAKNQFMH